VKVDFKINSASEYSLLTHLMHCDNQFVPALSTRVSLTDYVRKIAQNAIIFEAWLNGILVGMVAMYLNQNNSGYITNVSVYSEYGGRGIAKQLLTNLISYVQKENIKSIRLEVNPMNTVAINLYMNFGFEKIEESDTQVIMLKQKN
jgi:ribosomal protein S18 acetylase RimI-like enzyme